MMQTAEAQSQDGFIPQCLERQSWLTVAGVAFLMLAVLATFGLAADPRTVGGDPTWLKPLKFLISLGVFSLTMAWFYGYLPQSVRRSKEARVLAVVVIVASVFEAAYIALQASRGEASHFNISSGFHTLMYALMGVGAVSLTATSPWLGWMIARKGGQGLDPAYKLSVVSGLVLTFALGVIPAVLMSARLTHGVGEAAGGVLPFLGWSTSHGDLRPAHFVGIHAQQALPLLGLAATRLKDGRRWVWVGAALWSLLTLALVAQALAGRPVLAL